MKEVIKILMERDGLSYEEAEELYRETSDSIFASDMDYDEVEDIMADMLGLEMDYIFDFI